jgi:hypothetical protein
LMHRPTLDERLALAAAVLRYEEALVKIESGVTCWPFTPNCGR